MMDPRYAGAVLMLLAVAAIPTALHGYIGLRHDDGRSTAAIPTVLEGASSQPFPRRAGWAEDNFSAVDYAERVYRVSAQDVRLMVVRSYDAKRLYHHPELAALRGYDTAGAGVHTVASRPDVPLHVLTARRDQQRGVSVYALLYDDRYIASPITFQLRTSLELLFSGRKPLALVMATDLSGSVDRLEEAPATKILLSALDAFDAR